MATLDIKLKTYEQLQFEVLRLITDNHLKDKEIEILKNELAKIPRAKMEYDLEIERLNNIIDKSIEYIEEHIKYECDGIYSGMSFYSHHLYDNFKKEDLLNILKGETNERKDN